MPRKKSFHFIIPRHPRILQILTLYRCLPIPLLFPLSKERISDSQVLNLIHGSCAYEIGGNGGSSQRLYQLGSVYLYEYQIYTSIRWNDTAPPTLLAICGAW